MVMKALNCIHCESVNVVKYGKKPNGIQRLQCKECKKVFQEDYMSQGAKPDVKLMIVKMSLNGSGIRDIARVLNISTNTVLTVLKKLNTFLQA